VSKEAQKFWIGQGKDRKICGNDGKVCIFADKKNMFAMLPMRLYTAGIANFERIRQDGRIYIDKTDLIYKLSRESQFVFLSRPRRFGKSLLCSTLKYYFQGRKDLFEGLAIAELEKDWLHYPVLHFDISQCKNQMNTAGIVGALEFQLRRYEEVYGRAEEESTPGTRFAGLLHRAHVQTGLKAVVILDEYDAPLLDYLHKPEMLEQVRHIMQEFYQTVKVCDADEQFVFIAGITKFSQLSIFSTLNNLRDISMLPQYSAICGITKNELETVFDEDIQLLADEAGCSKQQTLERLKLQYDGYHFGKKSEDIFNPFSLMYAFTNREIDNYWFASGTPTFLFEEMKRFNTNLLELEQLQVPSTQFDVPTEGMTSALPLLYQAGYLTIKGYDFDRDIYTLDFPNAEVKVGFMDNFLVRMMNLGNTNSRGFAGDFYAALLHHNIEEAMKSMQAFFASIPYLDFGEKELDDITKYEAYYEVLTYVVFSIFNCRTFTQVKVARGRTDVVVFMRDATYVMELKMHGTAEEALKQIDSKDYAIPYQTEGKPIFKIGIAFSQETRTVSDWKIEH
jgi:hypothetical protein